ncbi:hypothetical protein ACJX0J_031495, partial [Zea mays]
DDPWLDMGVVIWVMGFTNDFFHHGYLLLSVRLSQNIIIEQFTLLTDCAIGHNCLEGKIIRLGASEFPLFNFYSTQNILFALWNSGMSTACENAQTEIVLTESIMFDCLRAQTKTESLCLFLKLFIFKLEI